MNEKSTCGAAFWLFEQKTAESANGSRSDWGTYGGLA